VISLGRHQLVYVDERSARAQQVTGEAEAGD